MSELPVSKEEMKRAAERLASAARSEPSKAPRQAIEYSTRGEMRPEKKYSSLTIALEFPLKREFEAICVKQERSPSSVGRRLIEDYVRANRKEDEPKAGEDTPEWHAESG